MFSVGDDNKLLGFDYEERKLKRKGILTEKGSTKEEKIKKVTASTLSQYPPNQQGRAIAYCPHNEHVVVSNNMGKVTVRSATDLNKMLVTLKEAEEWNEVIKFSPCGKYVAVGSHDNRIYVYDVTANYQLYYTCNKHNSFVTSLDWSADSTYIRSVCGAYEKLYFNIKDKSFDNFGLSNTKDYSWATNSCKIGWDVEGIFPSGEDGSHINGVDTSADQQLIATADDFGLLNVYRYPVCSLKHKAKSYSGHSEHVVRALFTKDKKRIFTIGGYDKAIIQWKLK